MRNFPDFFDAYQEHFQDNFVPEQFNQWACISAVAAALERKVWLPWSDSWTCYPNLYVLFVSGPGEGKTQALSNAVDLLEDANKKCGGTIKVMPNQATEAAFIRELSYGRSFTYGSQVINQSAAYYRAAEASACLKNIFGDFLACLTDLYDCPNKWARATISSGGPIEMKNVCVNLLAASTFDYLNELVNDKNIMGGFASRLIYVLSQKTSIRAQKFQNGGQSDDQLRRTRNQNRIKLVEDLKHIHGLMGRFTADSEFAAAWESWWVESETFRKACPSEKLQSLYVRQNLHLLKTSMVFSACESDDLILKKKHWERAIGLVEPCMKNIPHIFRESRANAIDRGQVKNLPHAIYKAILNNPQIGKDELKASLQFSGATQRDIDSMLHQMLISGRISLEGAQFKILSDPDNYL